MRRLPLVCGSALRPTNDRFIVRPAVLTAKDASQQQRWLNKELPVRSDRDATPTERAPAFAIDAGTHLAAGKNTSVAAETIHGAPSEARF